ncbi:MAG TPA: alkaline phosphatase family protein [Terriglobales bacterium]
MSVSLSNPWKLLLLFICLLSLTSLVGCRGIVAMQPTTSKPPVISSFTAAATTITAGQSTPLTWTVTGATSVTIDNGVGNVATSGSASVSPAQTTSYTLTASGSGGTSVAHVTITVTTPGLTVAITADPTAVSAGQTSTLTVSAGPTATTISVACTDSTGAQQFSGTLPSPGGTLGIQPKSTVTCVATASAATGQPATASVTVTVKDVHEIAHVIFLMQENRSFDNYFGMLNPYRKANSLQMGDDGKQYDVDGIDDKLDQFANPTDEGQDVNLFKLTSSCIDDLTSAWLESFGDVNRFDFSPSREILMNGFVHIAEGFAKSGAGSGQFSDPHGRRAMGYYDQDFLNYYYFMASQFALSDRWFSPMASKTIPNRLATMSGGTTQGLVRDPSNDDHVGLPNIKTIFEKLDAAGVSWKIYYSSTQDECPADQQECATGHSNRFPQTTFSYFDYAFKYLHENPSGAACAAPTLPSSQAVADPGNAFCIDPSHIAPVSQFITDLNAGTLPAFAYIEPAYGLRDEHPGSGNSVLVGQQEMAKLINAFMASPSWKDSVFFLSYDEGGGPFDHVPPVPGQTNDFPDSTLGIKTDIKSIAVNPDDFFPCVGGKGDQHCDLKSTDPGAHPGDAAAQSGFAAQLGFRVPNMVISPFTRKHYVAHTPMDHTAIIKFVEDRFIGDGKYLTARDAAQPSLNEFFDFANAPWKTPPTPPTPVAPGACHPGDLGP